MKYTTLDQLTVGQYQELYRINRGDEDDLDKSISCVSVLTGLTRWEVEDMALTDFNKVAAEINKIFSAPQVPVGKPPRSVTIFKKKYHVLYNMRKISAGQYIDLQHFLSGNVVENLHKIIACLLVKREWLKKDKYDAGNHELISEGVQELNYLQVNNICVFFSKLWASSIKALEPYLLKEMKKKGIPLKEMDLHKIMAGYTMPNV